MNWDAFWSGLLGTTIPAAVVSVLMVYLSHRTNRAIEQYKSDSAKQLSDHKLWHEKRITALLAIHDSFQQFLDWLRRSLYCSPPEGLDITPLHDFFNSIQKHLIYLNDDLQETIMKYKGELLQFWNWTITLKSDKNPESWKRVQERLDYEIPEYLEKLRQEINTYADPKFKIQKNSVKVKET